MTDDTSMTEDDVFSDLFNTKCNGCHQTFEADAIKGRFEVPIAGQWHLRCHQVWYARERTRLNAIASHGFVFDKFEDKR